MPDDTAAYAHSMQVSGEVVGDISVDVNGWQATAYPDPEHRGRSEMGVALPPADTEAEACRAVLRWRAAQEAALQASPPYPLPAGHPAVA